jgi:hypothetical protein
MRSQSVTASKRNVRFVPLAFTEQGVAMLSAVLRSDRAVQMSIAIVRTFVRMRELMAANKDIAARVEKPERGHDRTASVIEGTSPLLLEKNRVKATSRVKRSESFTAGVGRALRRAAKAARKAARMHGTPIYISEGGKIAAKKP